jgi:preprotein translocase SecE subunit
MESAPLSQPAPESEAPRGLFAPYKEDQGRHVRMAAFWSLVFFIGFGCRFLHDILIQWPAMREALGGVRLPVVGVDMTPAFLISMVVFAVGVLIVQRWLRRPRIADLLIETEAELLKVTWPKGQEVWNASMVVLVSVVLLGVYLAGVDIFLFRLMRALILGNP